MIDIGGVVFWFTMGLVLHLARLHGQSYGVGE